MKSISRDQRLQIVQDQLDQMIKVWLACDTRDWDTFSHWRFWIIALKFRAWTMREDHFGRWLCPLQSAIRISMTQNLQCEKVSQLGYDCFIIRLTPGWQMAFSFWAKIKIIITYVTVSVKTLSTEIKTISSSFVELIYIFNIFYHLCTFEPRMIEVWKGKKMFPGTPRLGVKHSTFRFADINSVVVVDKKGWWQVLVIREEGLLSVNNRITGEFSIKILDATF